MPGCRETAISLLAALCTVALAGPKPEVIVAPPEPSDLTDLAARELQRYLYVATGELLPIRTDGDVAGSGFVLGGPEENPFTRGLMVAGALKPLPEDLDPQGYVLRTLERAGNTFTIAAGKTPVATMYAVYDLLERYGYGFYLGGDAVPERRPLEFLALDEVRQPVFKIRGSLPWYNFLNSPTTWNLADHKRFYDQMAKMRMNFVGFHAYDYEPFTAVEIDGQWQFGQPLQNTSQGVWGAVAMKVSEFGFGTADCFTGEYYGAEASFGWKTPAEGIERAQALLAEGLAYARERGLHVCVGFEVHGDPSDPTNERNLELRLRHLIRRYPMVEYVWLWQAEGRGMGGDQPVPPRNTPFGNYYWQVRSAFEYLQQPARIAEAARISYYAHLGHNILQKIAPEVRLIISGWGGDQWMRFSDFYVGLDRTLPRDVIFAALDNIDPTVSPHVSHAYGEVSPERERWPIPWFESDGGGTRRDQWSPQCNVKPFTALCRDALAKGAQGLLGIHWRTGGVEEVAAYVAQFAWNPELSYEEFYDGFAERCFGPKHAQEMSRILQELEALGPRYTGARGQVECGGFTWFSDGERPKPENLAKLAEIEARLVALRDEIPLCHRDRLGYLLHTIRWVTKYDAAAIELQPGGPVERLIEEAEQAKAAGGDGAGEKAQAALKALRASGLSAAFAERARLLRDRGDMGVLATANGKAYAAYRELERRISKVLGQALPPEPAALDDLELAVPVTPDRLYAGEPLVVRAIARTDKPPVLVALRLRSAGEDKYREVPTTVVERCTYEATLPAEEITGPCVEFFMVATDAAGRQKTLPAGGPEAPWSALVINRPPVVCDTPLEAPAGAELAACENLQAKDAGPYQVALCWTTGEMPPRYWRVERTQAGEKVVIGEPRMPGHIDFGVMPRTRYSYAVSPVGWDGQQGVVRSLEFQTPDYPPPGKPGPLAAAPGVRRVQLRWPAGQLGVASYRVLRTVAGQAEAALEPGVEASATDTNVFVDADAPPDTDLTYRVIAVALSGAESEPSDPLTVRAWARARPVLTMRLDDTLDSDQGWRPHAQGAPELVNVGRRKALRLGPGRWLSFNDRPELDIPAEITLEAWAKFDDVDGIPVLISHARWMQEGYFLQVLGGRVRFHVALVGGTLVADAGRIDPGRWYHMVGTFDGQAARIYVNGELVGTFALPGGVQPAMMPYHGPLHIGRYHDPGPQYEVHGLVSGIGVFNGALSGEEVKARYEAEVGKFAK